MSSKKIRDKIIVFTFILMLFVGVSSYFVITVDHGDNSSNDINDSDRIDDYDGSEQIRDTDRNDTGSGINSGPIENVIPSDSVFVAYGDPSGYIQNEKFLDELYNIMSNDQELDIDVSEREDILNYVKDANMLFNIHLLSSGVNAEVSLEEIDSVAIYGDVNHSDLNELRAEKIFDNDIAVAISGGFTDDEFEEMIYNSDEAIPKEIDFLDSDIEDTSVTEKSYEDKTIYEVQVEVDNNIKSFEATTVDENIHIIGNKDIIKKSIDTINNEYIDSFDSQIEPWNNDGVYYGVEYSSKEESDTINRILFEHEIDGSITSEFVVESKKPFDDEELIELYDQSVLFNDASERDLNVKSDGENKYIVQDADPIPAETISGALRMISSLL